METVLYKGEVVTYSGGTAKVKSIYANGFVILVGFDWDNPPKPGERITGLDSKNTITLGDNFNVNEDYSFYEEFEKPYPPPNLLCVNENTITPDGVGGPWIATDDYFTGLPSQNAQTEYFIVVE